MIPTDSQDRKDSPVFSGFCKYFPKAMFAVAQLSKAGNDKHNPGEPLQWSREKSADHGDCIIRHQLEAGTIDPSDGFYHDVKVAWRAMAQLEILLDASEGVEHLDFKGEPTGKFFSAIPATRCTRNLNI